MPPQGSRFIDHLREHGPSTSDELPTNDRSVTLSPKVRLEVARFGPSPSRASGREYPCSVGKLSTVYYLLHEHRPEEVLTKWATANPQLIDTASPRVFIAAANNTGSEFSAVSKKVAKRLYTDEQWAAAYTGGGQTKGEPTDPWETRNELLDADADEI